MRHLAPLDRVLVSILVPLWVVCFGLALRTQVQGAAVAAVGLSVESADTYPVLTGDFLRIMHPSDPLAAAGLRAGDRLVRLGDANLLGVGTLGFFTRSFDAEHVDLRVPLVFERDGERREGSLALVSWSMVAPQLVASFAVALSALFLLMRGRPTPTVRAYFYFGMCWALEICAFPASHWESYLWFVMWVGALVALFPLACRFTARFPDDRMPARHWLRMWPWLVGLAMGAFAALQFTQYMRIGELGLYSTSSFAILVILAIATHKYRNTDRLSRRQMKWVLFGTYCAQLPIALAAIVSVLLPQYTSLLFASFAAGLLMPLALVVSVLRFNLFDIDRVLSVAASYNILAVVVGAGALIVIPRLAAVASQVLGFDRETGQVALSLLLAAAVIPAHRRLRPQIDRLFFKERYALDHGFSELLIALSACTDARELTERVGKELCRMLRPEVCVIYARVSQSYAPVYVEGRAVPPAFDGGSGLVAGLRVRRTPLALGGFGRRPDAPHLSGFDRAALETLRAEVVVPVLQGKSLSFFLCLGPKRSGDVYTSTDLSLLTAVAETMSRELQRFDQEDVNREAVEMQDALRRYVPGAIAEELSSGGALTSGERDVSILFVDIRGYTSFSERRAADEIFSVVNRYTGTVSEVVGKRGGAVVEFNGDGMMAVFGAPRDLSRKERAAVEAGREIVDAVEALAVDEPSGGRTKLSVGVGIATGPAFVGNIQAVDRMIWSAIGNTTNLAARLEALTRDLEAAVVIDSATWHGAQPSAEEFEKRSQVAVRGRREKQDLYVLPLRATSP